ncbi:MAG: RraA family protein [Betaproteobacteria bacterium]|nr:RraA family protein [Betaproteobacteria bacterium]
MEIGDIERPSAELIAKFRNIPTSTISDVLDGMQVNGVILNLRPCRSGIRFVGPAVTVKGVTGVWGTYEAQDYAFGEALDACLPGDVLVQDICGERVSCLGGIAAFAAKHRGVAGTVVDGGARDVDEINECGFAVVARHFVPTGAKTRIKLIGCNVPVKIDGVAVAPGDIIVADASAVAVVPRAVAAEVAEAALEGCRQDEQARAEIARGLSFTEAFRKFPKM